MKNTLLLTVAAILLCACTKDDIPQLTENKLAGTWVYAGTYISSTNTDEFNLEKKVVKSTIITTEHTGELTVDMATRSFNMSGVGYTANVYDIHQIYYNNKLDTTYTTTSKSEKVVEQDFTSTYNIRGKDSLILIVSTSANDYTSLAYYRIGWSKDTMLLMSNIEGTLVPYTPGTHVLNGYSSKQMKFVRK
jgi:hypothetical protein